MYFPPLWHHEYKKRQTVFGDENTEELDGDKMVKTFYSIGRKILLSVSSHLI